MQNNSGNALFLILIAVALFAALSYAVTQSGRGGKGINEEEAELAAAQVMQVAASVEVGLQRFLITGGQNLENIDLYDADKGWGGFDNSNCSTDDCNLFHPDGGGIEAPLLPAAARGSQYTACPAVNGQSRYTFIIISIEGVGSDLPELLLVLCGVRPEVCEKINRKLGIKAAGGAPVLNSAGTAGTDHAYFTGDMSPFPVTTAGQIGSIDARLVGQHSYCQEIATMPGMELYGNYFYHVLRAR